MDNSISLLAAFRAFKFICDGSKTDYPPVCYPADHHQVHDQVCYSVPVAHHDGVRCPQIRLSLQHRQTSPSVHSHIHHKKQR